jgi:hypothetical protein
VSASDICFLVTEMEIVLTHEFGSPVIHAHERREGVSDDASVVAEPTGGDNRAIVEGVTSNGAVSLMEFVEDDGKKEGGKGTALFHSFV